MKIDRSDLDLMGEKTWFATKPSSRNKTMYAMSNNPRQAMHRLIMGLKPGDKRSVDHRNGDGLDNRRVNLRIATPGQNNKNLPIYANNKSGYKGVFQLPSGKYRASIAVEGKRVYLGVYDTPELAAAAYNGASRIAHGEFGRLNDV